MIHQNGPEFPQDHENAIQKILRPLVLELLPKTIIRLGLTSFSTITRELWVVEFFGLHIRNPEEILDDFDVSYVPNKNVDFFRKNSRSPRAYTSLENFN